MKKVLLLILAITGLVSGKLLAQAVTTTVNGTAVADGGTYNTIIYVTSANVNITLQATQASSFFGSSSKWVAPVGFTGTMSATSLTNTLPSPKNATATFTLLSTMATGTYNYSFTYNYRQGSSGANTSAITVNVTVIKLSATLIANSSTSIGMLGTVNFTVTPSDGFTGSGDYTYTWSVISGVGVTMPVANSDTKAISFANTGTYVVKVAVSRDGKTVISNSVNVTVSAVVVNAGKNQVVTGSSAQLHGTVLPAGTSIVWSQVSGPSAADLSGQEYSLNPLVSNLTVGTYTFKMAYINNPALYKTVYVYVTGSRGATITNIDFGTGTSSQPLSDYLASIGSSGTTDLTYTHINSACPDDAFYSIRPATGSCFINTWLPSITDHTGNTNGRMLIVNATASTLNAGNYFQQNISDLCSGSAYEFSFWVANLNAGTACVAGYIAPSFTLLIYKNSVAPANLVLSKSTGDIERMTATESDVWERYAATVEVPNDAGSLILVIQNNNLGGCGNDFALDDIQFTAYGVDMNAGVGASNIAAFTTAIIGETYSITGSIEPVVLDNGSTFNFTNPVYQWQHRIENVWTDIPGATNNVYNIASLALSDTGRYRLITAANSNNIVSTNCRLLSNEAQLTLLPEETPLAVKLGKFTAEKEGTYALLKWQTFSEVNNDRFEIERGTDAVHFIKTGTVKGNLTTAIKHDYGYQDPISELTGVIYYRLRIVDIYGKISYSRVVSIRIDVNVATGFTVYPNPFTADIKIKANSNKETTALLRVSNITGQQLLKQSVTLHRGQNTVTIQNIQTLKPGTYIVELMTADNKFIQKVIKN